MMTITFRNHYNQIIKFQFVQFLTSKVNDNNYN